MYTSQSGNRHPRYFVALADDGAFLITDRKAVHKRTARFLPVQFVYGQGGYDDATRKYPDYVHGQLWALHDARSRAQLAASQLVTVTEPDGRTFLADSGEVLSS